MIIDTDMLRHIADRYTHTYSTTKTKRPRGSIAPLDILLDTLAKCFNTAV
jgi:hypothetical protein